MKTLSLVKGILVAALLISTGVIQAQDISTTSKPFIVLPPEYNTPDGLAVNTDGTIIMSVPNYNNKKLQEKGLIQNPVPAFMAIINKDNSVDHWYDFQKQDLHPITGVVGPMDAAFGPDGNLYVADMQVFFNANHQSRLLRINVVDGKPVNAEVLVEGFVASNGMFWEGNRLFITDSAVERKPKHLTSGVYSFTLEELNKKSPIILQPYQNGKGDPHLALTLVSENSTGFGADGITFDDKGYMYTTVSENGKIYKSKLNKDFKATETKLFATAPQMKGPDGMIFSKEYNSFFVADYMNNAVHQISKTGKVTTLQLNGDTDGTDGKLTQPCEVALRGSELIIVNMNIDAKIATPYTLSKIDLKPL